MSNIYVDTAENKALILSHMNASREDKKLIDVVLVAGRDKIKVPAHRLLLSSRSEYFSNMFSSSSPQYKRLEIPIDDVFGKDLMNIIQYCYTGIIELGNDNAEAVLATACLFKLTDLIKTCQTFMSDKMSAANCLGLWAVAEKYNCRNLLEQARSFVCDHFTDVSKSQEFLRLDNGRLRELIGLGGTSQDEILLSLIRWLQHEQRERAHFASGLLSLVRVPLLSPAFVVEHKDFIVDSIEDIAFIKEIFKWHVTPIEKRPAMEKNETLLAVMIGNRNSGKIHKYYHQNDEWTTWTQIEQNQNRKYFGVAIMNDELITAGGWYNSKALNTVLSTNLKTKISKPLKPMGACRSNVAIVVLKNNIYAIGGEDNDGWLSSVERLYCGTEKWNNVASMTEEKRYPRAAVLNDHIYAIGSGTTTLECYNPLTNEWTLCAPMHEIHAEPGVAVLKKYLYVIGGFNSRTVERYHCEENTWTKITPFSYSRLGFGCIAMKDRIIAAGGCIGLKDISNVNEYNPMAKKIELKENRIWHRMPNEKRPTMERNETLLAVMTSDDNDGKIHKYFHQNDEWAAWTQIERNHNRRYFGVAIMDDELITAGGWCNNSGNSLHTVLSISLKTKTSKLLRGMIQMRPCVSNVVLNNNIYAIGGYNELFGWLDCVERLDDDKVQSKHPQAVDLNDRIYVIGRDTKTLECYDPLTDTWTFRASLYEKHDEPGVAVLNDHLYVVGGVESKTVERYHYQTNTWTKICSLSSPRWVLGCIAMKDYIFAVGGVDNGTVEEYDPITDVWTPKSNLNDKGRCILVLTKGIP